MADLGVIKLGNYSATNTTWTGVTGTQPVLDDMTTPVDGTYAYDSDNGTASPVDIWFPLDNMPTDFESMDTLSIQIRYHRPNYDSLKTVSSITAQIFTADGGATNLTASATLASTVTNTAATDSSVVGFTGVTASDKATWDGAWLKLTITQSKSKAGSTDETRVTAAELTGTYTQAVATVPDTPTGLTATHGNQQVSLSWTAPADDGGAAITDYLVEYNEDSGGWTTFTDGVSTNTTATVTGLTNGLTSLFRVSAINSVGTGSPSATDSATPATVPGQPTGLTATAGDGQASLSWTAPSSNGGSAITDYLVEYNEDSGGWQTFSDGVSTNTTATVTGLTNGLTSLFRVSAINAEGTGTASATDSATPAGAVVAQIYNGTSWVAATPEIYDGASWVTALFQAFDGAAWIPAVAASAPTVEGTYRNHWVGVTDWPQDFNPSFTVLTDDVIYAFLAADDHDAEVGLTLTMADQSGTSGGTWELLAEVRQTTTGRMMQGALWRKVVTDGTNESGVTYRANGGGTEEGSVDMLLVRGAYVSAPTFESQTFTSVTSGTSIAVTGPSTCNEGDLLIATLMLDDTQLAITGSTTGSLDTIPSGWTELESGVVRSAGGDVSGHLYWKLAGVGDVATGTPNTYTWGDATGIAGSAHIVRVSGVDQTTPIADTSVIVTAAASTSMDIPSVTTSADNSLLVALGGSDESSTYTDYWSAPPITGFTAVYGSAGVSQGEGDSNVQSMVSYATQAAAGASGAKTASVATENDALVGFLVAVSPAKPEDATTTSGSEFYSGGRTDSAPTNPAITTASANALVLLFQNTNGNDITAIAAPSGYTKHTEPATIPTVHVISSSASKVAATAGTETPGTWTMTGSASFDDSIMFTVAVRPA